MSTLYLIDNPSAFSLADDTDWQARLPARATGDDKVLLIGFITAQLIVLRRHLAQQGVAESRVVSVMNDSADTLSDCDPALFERTVSHVIEGLRPSRIHCHVHAGQSPRFAELVAAIERTGPTEKGQGSAVDLAVETTAEVVTATPARPRLAFVSPLPPQATGIACYSAELLPYLAEHFAITLVVDQTELDPLLSQRFEVLDTAQFETCADDFDYVLYQVGNSLYHAYQFGLLRRHPGVVVLHDYYLFDAVWWLQESALWPGALRQQLYHDHGYVALVALDADTDDASSVSRGPEQYPVNGFVTQQAAGLVYHSAFASRLAEAWQQGHDGPCAIIPHLRELPEAPDREAARRRMDVSSETRLIASFGGINPKKLSDRLVDAFLDGPLADRRDVQLVLVGAQHSGDFGRHLARRLTQHPAGRRVTITGYVERTAYTDWLAAADVAVQLRQDSRGETSGAVLDAMAHGLPVIVNAHGSSTELPADSVVMLPEAVTCKLLSDRLIELIDDTEHRQRLARAGREHVANALAPPHIAEQYRRAIVDASQAPRHCRERRLDQLAANPALRTALEREDANAHAISRALVELDTGAVAQPPRLLFDVSTIAWHDLKTGIERVTRRLADQLLRQPPPGWRVELIRWGGDDFYLARGFASDQLGLHAPPGPDVPIEARPGDVYLSVEWAPPLLKQAGHVMQRLRAQGVRFYFTVHDLLPLSLPHCFPPEIPATMRDWFDAIAALADGITCVSRDTATDVTRHLAEQPPGHRPWVSHFHLGADFSATAITTVPVIRDASDEQLLQRLAALDGPTLLMVGTMEPRKGHRQVLDAIERLWQQDEAINLVIVGKQGWDVADLARRIPRHPQHEHRLFWVQGASDALLARLYAGSDCLVAASLGEGFGLPLIEAAHHGIPILARDIPVFREVAGEHASYFRADTSAQLAEALLDWRRRWQEGNVPDSRQMPFQDWAKSTEQWLTTILADLPEPRVGGVS